MKNVCIAFLVVILAVPALAVTFTASNPSLGKLRISYDIPAGEVLRAVALKLCPASGAAAINASTDIVVYSPFNTFPDYAYSYPVGYAVGAGHPFAETTMAGAIGSFPVTGCYSLCLGVLDPTGNKGGATGTGILCDIQYAVTGASATINIAGDTLRGAVVVGDNITQPVLPIDQVLLNQCNVSTPTLVKAGDRGVNTNVTSITASATSSLGHTLEYSFNWGSGYGAYGAAIQTNTYAFTAAGTESITAMARCTADGSLSTASVAMVLTRECVKFSASFYNDWKATTALRSGKMACWAFKKQCKGDADGIMSGTLKAGYVAVYTTDLAILTGAWNIKEPVTGTCATGMGLTNTQMCADFDHVATGTCKSGYVRVYTPELIILTTNWNIKEPATGTTPTGPGIGNCPASNYNFYTN
jgi:hypothetical protein